MCLSILVVYCSDSLKLRFPVVMSNCLWIASAVPPFAFLEKYLQRTEYIRVTLIYLDDVINSVTYINVLRVFGFVLAFRGPLYF